MQDTPIFTPVNFEHIVETLALQQYCVIDACLPGNTLQALRHLAVQRASAGWLRQAGIGKQAQTASQLRSDHIAWLEANDPDPALQAYFSLMQSLQVAVNRGLMMGVQQFETHFAMFPAGALGYATHLDQFQHPTGQPSSGERRLSSVLYLNEAWPIEAGGALRLYLEASSAPPNPEAKYLDIAPIAGRWVVFCSERFWHQVLPSHQPRFSLTGWFKTAPPHGVSF